MQAVNEFLSRDGSLVTHARGCHLWCRTLRTVVASLPTGVTAFDSMQNTTEKSSQTLAGQGLAYTPTTTNKQFYNFSGHFSVAKANLEIALSVR